ncbi:hypothetical protein [Adhaeribacter radiodurans]|uniref:Uncharacterized protein n=1 Tax=Adhaeribacter radiodurans TaxID=2745197 RepID=A0A7L7LDI1_9BACT|nr:hypothetical protein [Adhaeribacter radiodurans]QMU30906.1 hypothetical protein HUW48_24040 [Adhaeribacter radiodurans]
MKTPIFIIALKIFAYTFFMSAIVSCKSNSDNKKVLKSDSLVAATTSENKESIPDSIVQFLITSASSDFRHHQPPTPIDFRKVKVGYLISSTNEKTFLLCGEFLSQEKKEEWETFATVKTSGYEQYIGNQALPFCQKATIISPDETNLSVELKNRLVELRKQK